VSDFEIVMGELKSFSESMVEKPMIVVATKLDAAQDPARIKALQKIAKKRKLPFMKISSVTGEGIDALKRAMWDTLQAAKGEGQAAEPAP
jgi:GTP-binding protein